MDVYTREWRDALSLAMPHPLRLHGLRGDVDLVERQAGAAFRHEFCGGDRVESRPPLPNRATNPVAVRSGSASRLLELL